MIDEAPAGPGDGSRRLHILSGRADIKGDGKTVQSMAAIAD